jgi:molybdate-binding protein/DNA-binding XRE family transcriptional regulator
MRKTLNSRGSVDERIDDRILDNLSSILLSMPAMGEKHRAEPAENIENNLRKHRTAKGFSQGELARLAGVTRQAIYAIENNQYLPTTAVGLRLAGALGCRVEDLFSLVAPGEVIEGDLVGPVPSSMTASEPARVKVARVGKRVLVRPVATLGEILNYTVPADGLLMPTVRATGQALVQPGRVRVRLLRDRRSIEQEIIVAGCDPSLFLAGEYLRRRREQATVVEWLMGSAAALEALKRGEVHVAGLHIMDAKSGESNLPYLRRHLRGGDVTVVTFASWEQGLIVRSGNPKRIRGIDDLARRDVTITNREEGSGARLLLDSRLAAAGIPPGKVRGYKQIVGSHLAVARSVAQGQADTGLGIRSTARLLGLDFIPVQEERYDLVIPTPYLSAHPALSALLDTIVSRPFRTEIEALGGYDTKETGKVHSLRDA